jgi:hypothetical protein
MAKRGSTKDLSVRQEDFIAATYGGKRSASSGAADNDAGDVRCDDTLFECKVTGGPTRPSKLPIFVQQMEKIAEEAYEESRHPALALRYYEPDSILANREGWIDLVVRRVDDDSCRS